MLSVDIGSTPGGAGIPGVANAAIPAKPIDRFLTRLEAARQRILAAEGKAHIAIVGGGAASVELAMALRHRLHGDLTASGHDPEKSRFTLVTSASGVLSSLAPATRTRISRILAEQNIVIRSEARVVGIDGRRLLLAGGAILEADEVFWTTQAAAAPWLARTGLAVDAGGFLAVDDTLQSLSRPGVFGAGDCASMAGRDLPKSGVYAVRQGPYLNENIRRFIAGRPLKRYRPQSDALYLVTTGDRYAVGTRNGFAFEGRWVWRWKDRIDRAFMDKFNRLPEMAPPAAAAVEGIAGADAIREISALAMRCGGCGAKVGASILSRALGQIEPVKRADVLIGLDAPDDAAVVDAGGSQLSVHTVDYFRAIVDDPYTFGRIAANHALGDIYAMGAAPQSALAIATIPYGLESKVEAALADLMTGANEILREAGCALVGGHTSEGAELALGFAVTGLIDRGQVLRKGGMEPGDALILTKPIGTGTLLAADMRGKAKARWVMAAIQHMTASNRAAAEILRRHGVHAATDVTGFGLLGHLVEMVKASGVDVTLCLNAVPILEGAAETVALGLFSSLQPQNVRLRRAVRNLGAAFADPAFPLLFDPQTAGGLLASAPADQAVVAVAALRAAGYERAAVIGAVSAQTDVLEPVVIDLAPIRSMPRAPNHHRRAPKPPAKPRPDSLSWPRGQRARQKSGRLLGRRLRLVPVDHQIGLPHPLDGDGSDQRLQRAPQRLVARPLGRHQDDGVIGGRRPLGIGQHGELLRRDPPVARKGRDHVHRPGLQRPEHEGRAVGFLIPERQSIGALHRGPLRTAQELQIAAQRQPRRPGRQIGNAHDPIGSRPFARHGQHIGIFKPQAAQDFDPISLSQQACQLGQHRGSRRRVGAAQHIGPQRAGIVDVSVDLAARQRAEHHRRPQALLAPHGGAALLQPGAHQIRQNELLAEILGPDHIGRPRTRGQRQ